MLYTGIDYHKRHPEACTLDAQGRRAVERRIERNAPDAFAAQFAALGDPCEAVVEACWNREALSDPPEDMPGVDRVAPSNPARNRIIAEPRIKNDRVDARAPAALLRGGFVSEVRVPSKTARQKKTPCGGACGRRGGAR